MDELIAFVNARLDEDELAARNAGGETWDFTGTNCEVRVRPSGRKGYGDFGRVIAYTRHGNPVTEDLALSIHVSWHDPARVLREVAAKRAILREYQAVRKLGGLTGVEPDGYRDWVLRNLAAVYSDHADYRPEWAL